MAKNPQKSDLGPRRGRFSQIFRRLKKLRTVIPQPMSQKNPDFEPLSLSYAENTGSQKDLERVLAPPTPDPGHRAGIPLGYQPRFT